MPQANSTTSMPRCTEPIASASTLPCSSVTISASAFWFFFRSDRNSCMTRARRSGGVSRHSGNAAAAASTAASIIALSANTTRFGDLPARRVEHFAVARGGSDGLAADPGGDGFQFQFGWLVHAVARFPPCSLAIAALTRGITSSAISCIERFSSLASTQSMPA